MKKSLKFLGMLLLIATMFTACDKRADEVITEPQTYDYNVKKIAQATAYALHDEDFRNYVQSEAGKMFDGDYNFLIKDVLDHKFSDGMTFRSKLSREFVSVETFNQFIENTPKLQIAVPVHIGKWNTKTFVPSVAFLDENFDDKTTEFISAFDASQNLIEVAVKEEPNVPFVVISLNERVDNEGNLKEEKQAIDKVRYDGGMEQITKMRFDNLSAVEPWILGGPELRLQIRPAFWNMTNSVSLFGGVIYSGLFDIKRKDIDEKWYNLSSPYNNMFAWHRGDNRDNLDLGPSAQYVWWEEDNGGGGQQIPITASYTDPSGYVISVGFTLTIGNTDDAIGDSAVSYVDAEPTTYGIGNIFQWESNMQ